MEGPRYFGRPKAFVRYGERVGQGQRCAYVRLASHAVVYVPLKSRVRVRRGNYVNAGTDILATLVHK
jgi:phosphatidylserine decarboxylase